MMTRAIVMYLTVGWVLLAIGASHHGGIVELALALEAENPKRAEAEAFFKRHPITGVAICFLLHVIGSGFFWPIHVVRALAGRFR
jgi:hypothetical protein